MPRPTRQLVVRNVPEAVVRRLRERAARAGRSAEAEHRLILAAALASEGSFKDALLAMPDVGRDEDFARPRRASRKVQL